MENALSICCLNFHNLSKPEYNNIKCSHNFRCLLQTLSRYSPLSFPIRVGFEHKYFVWGCRNIETYTYKVSVYTLHCLSYINKVYPIYKLSSGYVLSLVRLETEYEAEKIGQEQTKVRTSYIHLSYTHIKLLS